MTFHPTISHFRRRRILQRRARHLAWMMQSRESCILRWHGGTLAELMAGWREKARGRHAPFVPGLYTAPRKRQRFIIRGLLKEAKP